MRYLTLLFATPPQSPPPPELFEAIMALGGDATRAGVLVDQGGLLPGGTTVAVTGGELTVLDGPFAETKELLSYAVYDVRTEADAVEWASRFLDVHRELWPGWTGTTRVIPVMGGEPPTP